MQGTMAKKVDIRVNGDVDYAKSRIKERELYPLRINHYTTILVPKDKCNDEYRQKYILKHINIKQPVVVITKNPYPSEEQLQKCAEEGMTYRQAADKLGYSYGVVSYYAQKFGVHLKRELKKKC